MELTDVQRKFLDLIQKDFPLTKNPWRDLANTMGITEDEVITMSKELKNNGVIRRIGGILDSKSMDYISCLCAVSVPEERLNTVALEINNYYGVTHNYERDNEYNLWFTLTCPSVNEREKIISDWEEDLNIKILIFPGIKTYKRNVTFSMQKED